MPELRTLDASFPTRKRLCYLVEGLRGVVEVRRPEDIPAARRFAVECNLPHEEILVAGRGLVLVVTRRERDLAEALELRREWNELTRDPEEVGRDLARLQFRAPDNAIESFGHMPAAHLIHDGRHSQEILDFQPCGMTEPQVRKAMVRRLRALGKHGLL